MENFHQPVLLDQVIHYLAPKSNQNFVDCTLGGGGHASEILKRTAPAGLLLGIDLDPSAIQLTQDATKIYKNRIGLVKDNFKNLKQILNDSQFSRVNGILFDLGLSSNQLQDHARGFSFLASGTLDMRFGAQSDLTASKILNTWSAEDLIKIFQQYGEEKLARPIALRIVEARSKRPISLSQEIVEIVSAVYKKYYRAKSKINPATKIFQALRIAVNDELENLRQVLPQAVESLPAGGRLAVLSYHSLEDKIVKNFFQQEAKDCLCPPQIPVCRCGHKKTLKIMTKKPIIPTAEEIFQNPRSRSAKLRVAEKV
ncbi:MAG: 16S rRNA (cytosine(1402)-N(4))-methyltransferase [Candidatus Buchananbacteria bacterium RIFCSPHIGHO2_01_FULL_44_11]|uniref:Ribosomal RNA small subunit methyltransferase H n=1 Tax=Candidatus Buchananbacteria bacterium RIFCSPHIGHO2_01_FULL_44_11 TaxID=1797535 RepID=A0A1G1XZ75_9BACT|nr:MAG: 16S rRNA (cytosine(1402)-N(4))-methyltransferase [Candidatus Buchananbacteria bacterium RIFCSPHIGHO2_01_FULL_44_11]